MKYWLAGYLVWLLGLLPLFALNEAESSSRDATGFETPEHGSEKIVSVGGGESMMFVWIEPLEMWVGRFEVTNGQYLRYDTAHNSGSFHGYHLNERNQPVVNVSWEDAGNYCSWLNRNFRDQVPAGYVFRLPTEDEWEVFARCGDNRKFPWGDTWPPPNEWNYRGEEGARGIFRFFAPRNFIRGYRGGFIVSAPVGQSGSNEWGLFGVGGNVWEWCEDWFDANKTCRAIRGASWSNYRKETLALTNRAAGPEYGKTDMIGFRVVIGKK